MLLAAKRLEDNTAIAIEDEDVLHLMEDWLRLEDEHTDPGFILPSRATVVAWCEDHPGTIVLSANALLWTPLIWAMCNG